MTPDRALEILALAERSADAAEPGRQEAFAQLLAANEDVAHALDKLSSTDPDLALRLAASLSAFWQDSGRVDEGRRTSEELLASSGGHASPARARTLVVASELAFRQGDQAAARSQADASIEAGRAAGDAGAVAQAHINLARIAYRDGDAADIERQARQALAVAPTDPAAKRGALHMLAWAAYTAGDVPGAIERFEESLALRQAMGDRFGIASEAANLADLAAEQGDIETAATRLGAALEVAVDLRSTYLILNLLPSIAAIAARSGADDDCARLLGATEALSRASGLVPDPSDLPVLDEARQRLGDRFESLRSEGTALSEKAAIDLAYGMASRGAAGARNRSDEGG